MSRQRQTLALAGLATFGFIVYLALLASPLARDVTILFYRGTLLAFAAALLAAALAVRVERRAGTALLAVPAFAVTLSGCVCFLVVFPVTIDRSISVYLLATIETQQAQRSDAVGLEQAFVAGYVRSDGAIERRIAEQVSSGNVTRRPDGALHLTRQGARFLRVSRGAARLFGIDPRFVDGFRPMPRSATRPTGS